MKGFVVLLVCSLQTLINVTKNFILGVTAVLDLHNLYSLTCSKICGHVQIKQSCRTVELTLSLSHIHIFFLSLSHIR